MVSSVPSVSRIDERGASVRTVLKSLSSLDLERHQARAVPRPALRCGSVADASILRMASSDSGLCGILACLRDDVAGELSSPETISEYIWIGGAAVLAGIGRDVAPCLRRFRRPRALSPCLVGLAFLHSGFNRCESGGRNLLRCRP